jgi:hypothetical protein
LTFAVFFVAFADGASGEPAAAALRRCFLVAILPSAPPEPALPTRHLGLGALLPDGLRRFMRRLVGRLRSTLGLVADHALSSWVVTHVSPPFLRFCRVERRRDRKVATGLNRHSVTHVLPSRQPSRSNPLRITRLPVLACCTGRKRSVVRVIAIVSLALVLTACNGGTVDSHALTNDSATIDSLNCEAWLLSRAVSRGRVASAFSREHAATLRVQASNLADALHNRPTAVGLETRVRAKADDAETLAVRLRRLHAHATDRPAAAGLARQFRAAGHCS